MSVYDYCVLLYYVLLCYVCICCVIMCCMIVCCGCSPIKVLEGDKAGVVADGPTAADDIDFQRQTATATQTFTGFESERDGIVHYLWAVGSKPCWDDVLSFSPAALLISQPLAAQTHGETSSSQPLTAQTHSDTSSSQPLTAQTHGETSSSQHLTAQTHSETSSSQPHSTDSR